MNCCYIVRRNAITARDVTRYREELAHFHKLREVFIETGVRTTVELPRQHAMMHYADGIELFGSPNGICSSITESKHIKAIKEPWRRSSRNQALHQMLRTISRLEKLAALRTVFKSRGMLDGSVAWYTAKAIGDDSPSVYAFSISLSSDEDKEGVDEDDQGDQAGESDGGPDAGARRATEVQLAARRRRFSDLSYFYYLNCI
jgi:hypothetical protein